MRLRALMWMLGAISAVGLLTGCNSSVSNAVDVSVGGSAACLINTEGGVECWGMFHYGPFDTVVDLVVDFGNTATALPGISGGATDISLGEGHGCAIVTGTVKCWGIGNDGQLGNGDSRDSAVPVDVVGLPVDDAAVQVETHRDHTCVRLASGAVWCWGSGGSGQLGDGFSQTENAPVPVNGLDGVTTRAIDISVGDEFSCAVTTLGTVGCWGSDSSGELGNGPGGTGSPVPALVPGLADIVDIDAGDWHACSLASDGTLQCWGRNDYEHISLGGGWIESPVIYAEFPSAVSRLAGGQGRTCVVHDDASAWCVGNGFLFSAGNGLPFSNGGIPTLVLGTDVDGVAVIDTGYLFGCAVGVSGDVKCWGVGELSEIGSPEPANVFR